MDDQAIAPPPAAPETYRFTYHGQGGAFFLVLLRNVLLTVLTLGIYAAWAKTARRKFIWNHTEFHGQRLIYTGTGQEVFVAYLKVAVVYIVLLGVPFLIKQAGSQDGALAAQIVLGVGLAVMIPFAMYWSRAYLLSRTEWRGIRLGLVRGAGTYARTFIGGLVLTVLTLGIYAPLWTNDLRRIMTESTRFGSEPFRYHGRGRDLFWIAARGLLLTVVTLGIYWFWWQAAVSRYTIGHTTFAGARGRSDLTGGFLLKVFLLYLFGTTLTLGLAFPWIATYALGQVLRRISFEGHIDFAAITQRAAASGAGGEALADALDVGLGV